MKNILNFDTFFSVKNLGLEGLISNIYRRIFLKYFFFNFNYEKIQINSLELIYNYKHKIPDFIYDKNVLSFSLNKYCLFGEKVEIRNNSWDKLSGNSLVDFHINYMDVLNDYNNKYSNQTKLNLILKFIKNNKQIQLWHPYSASRRVLNWIKFLKREGLKLEKDVLHNILVHKYFIRKNLETHLMANHYFTNLKALLFIECFFFDDFKERKYLIKQLNKQLKIQVLPDGGHFERSPTYHLNFLDDILDIMILEKNCRSDKKNQYKLVFKKINHIIKNIIDVSNYLYLGTDIVRFSDCSTEMTTTKEILNKKIASLSKLSSISINNEEISSKFFKNMGYLRVSKRNFNLFADIGPIGAKINPGHGHADIGSFELQVGERKIITNGGTSCYNGADRLRSRSTINYSTYVSNKGSSSNIFSDFRVAQSCKILKADYTSNCGSSEKLILEYIGRPKFFNSYKHCRSIIFEETEIKISDTIYDKYLGNVQFIIPNDIQYKYINCKSIVLSCGLKKIPIINIECTNNLLCYEVNINKDIGKVSIGHVIKFQINNRETVSTKIKMLNYEKI